MAPAIDSVPETDALPLTEAELLRLIREALPTDPGPEYRALRAKREAGTLTSEERQNFLALIDQREIANARRVKYLVELSELRHVSLDKLMHTLGIPSGRSRMEEGYHLMAADEEREAEALEWSEATLGDVADEPQW